MYKALGCFCRTSDLVVLIMYIISFILDLYCYYNHYYCCSHVHYKNKLGEGEVANFCLVFFLALFHKAATGTLQVPYFMFESHEDPIPVLVRTHRFQIEVERHGYFYFQIESPSCLDKFGTVCP